MLWHEQSPRNRGGFYRREAAPWRRALAIVGILHGFWFHTAVFAEEPTEATVDARTKGLSDRQVDERLDFLIKHLDDGRDYAWWWWAGWTTFYSLGVVVESTRAGLEHNRGHRADDIVGAVKAAGGTIVLVSRPRQARQGADPVRAVPGESPDDRRRQLVVAEDLLKANADLSKRRYQWQRHAINVAVNGIGAIIIWKGFDAPDRAWRSGVIGTGVGEASIWSQPWWPANDWEEYQRRFQGSTEQHVRWHIAPTIGGLAFQMNF